MPIGKIGGPRSNPGPKSTVTNEATALLAVFGRDDKAGKEVKARLAEMHAASEHNEKVLAAAKEAINEAAKAEQALTNREARFAEDSSKRSGALDVREAQLATADHALSTRVANFEAKAKAAKAEIKDQLASIEARGFWQDKHAKAQADTQATLDKRLTVLEAGEKEVAEAQKAVAARESGLRAFLK